MIDLQDYVIFNNRKYRWNGEYYSYGSKERLHTAIYRSVHGRIPPGHTVKHIDGNPRNNDVHNLTLVTNAQNIKQKHGDFHV